SILVQFNVSESPAEERKLKEQWYEQLGVGHKLHAEMIEAAAAEYKANPDGRRGLANMLHSALKHNFEDDRLEGMLGVAETLIKNNYPSEELELYAAMSAFGVSNYDAAKPYLQNLAQDGKLSAELTVMLEELDIAKKDWEQELKYREQDAQGEPLPRVLIRTTKGNIELELFENQAPDTVGNFIYLAEKGFYDHLTFHRVLEHFMVQGGCPNGDGRGGAEWQIYDENGKPDSRKFFRGTISMALGDPPNSASSQFFITLVPTPQLNERFTAFGRVVDGIDVLSNINRINPDKKDKNAPAVIPDEIITIEVLSKRNHEYKPNKVVRP
ncbi:MAG: peptidylprolyl isomerase, partial [Pirellulaceae bacterium]